MHYLSRQDALRLPFCETGLAYVPYAFLLEYKIQILDIAFDEVFQAQFLKSSLSLLKCKLSNTIDSSSVQLSQTMSA